MFQRLRAWLFTVLGILAIASLSFALPTPQKDSLTWDAVTTNVDGTPASDLAGYRVYWSQASGSYADSNRADVGNVTTISIKAKIGQLKGPYYFVVTAYDVIGNESAFSNEVNASFFVPKAAPGNLMVQ